ncbi:MAG: hypothetical protein LUE24_11055 [Lachnospiraceae bacterium]|nr:hypothetical protein [Lachnospiraceae bacterium]
MKYTGQYWIVIAPFTKRLLAKRYGRRSAKEYIEKAKPIYRQMLAGGGTICDYWFVGDREPDYSGKGEGTP